MNNTLKLLTVTAVILLSGCTGSGQTSSFSERMSDNFLFTSASSVSPSEVRCVTLTKPFVVPSASVTLPAGTYIGRKKISSGYFYFPPKEIRAHSLFSGNVDGIYINNQFNEANLFGMSYGAYDGRPVRTTVLPNAIFSFIKKGGRC